ncbi:MAG: hypothetical protein J6K58_12290 [Lachnospiraceae bacterium]|nr:hypothetical protein [Lachnospiraceae bacterium]
MKKLIIYIIEDDIQRLGNMEEHFEKYKEEFCIKDTNSELIKFLVDKGVDELESCVIKPQHKTKDLKNYDYFPDDENFINCLEKILENNELRIFMLDLALNEDERDIFSRNSIAFLPYTARKIIDIIKNSHQEEMVIFDTRVKNMGKNWQKWIEPDKEVLENIRISCIRVDAFAKKTTWEQCDIQICDAIKKVWKEDSGR